PPPVDELAAVGCRRDLVAREVEEEPFLHLAASPALATVHLDHGCGPFVGDPLRVLGRHDHVPLPQTRLLLQLPPGGSEWLLASRHATLRSLHTAAVPDALRTLPAPPDVDPLERQHLAPVRVPHHDHHPGPEVLAAHNLTV